MGCGQPYPYSDPSSVYIYAAEHRLGRVRGAVDTNHVEADQGIEIARMRELYASLR